MPPSRPIARRTNRTRDGSPRWPPGRRSTALACRTAPDGRRERCLILSIRPEPRPGPLDVRGRIVSGRRSRARSLGAASPVARGAESPGRLHRARRPSMRGAQQGSLIRLTGRHLSDDLAPEQDDRPVANEAYFRKLGREQAAPTTRHRPSLAATDRSDAWCRHRCRGSDRSKAGFETRRRSIVRSPPSADCRRSAGAVRTPRGRRFATA